MKFAMTVALLAELHNPAAIDSGPLGVFTIEATPTTRIMGGQQTFRYLHISRAFETDRPTETEDGTLDAVGYGLRWEW